MRLDLDDYYLEVAPVADSLPRFLQRQTYSGYHVLVDENTERHCLPLLRAAAPGLDFRTIVIPAGEAHKHLATCENIWRQLMQQGASRNALLVNLGGGVIGDMGGFCAATFKRGMSFLQIPTTLLSQVDASIGGKLGVDFSGIKNSIGVFRNPAAVLIDPAFYRTLPADEVRSGFAEIIKHALIYDASQWATLRTIGELSAVDWSDVLVPSLSVKRAIVQQDPFERGLRKALNFGHTIGHAVEGYALEHGPAMLHGEAVALGIIAESFLSHRAGLLSDTELSEIVQFVRTTYPNYAFPKSIYPDLLRRMRQDKKNRGTEINFTLVGPIGSCHTDRTADEAAIEAALDFYRAE